MKQVSIISKVTNRFGLHKYLAFYLLTGISVLAVSCKDKDKDVIPVEQTTSEKLTSHKWTSSNIEAIVDGKTYINKTDLGTTETTFKSDGTYIDYDLGTKETTTGTWKLDGSALTVTYEDVILKGKITDISGSDLTFTMPEVSLNTVDLENFEETYADIKGTDPKFMDVFQVILLVTLEYNGFDKNKVTNQSKFHIIYKFKS